MGKMIVIAIDIGQTHSCVLYSFAAYPNDIIAFTVWRGASFSNTLKVPTTVLFNEKKDFDSFGYEAENHYADLRSDEQKKWFYFRCFGKMTCDCKMESTLSDASGKKLDTYIVYGSAIKFFKDELVDLFREKSPIDLSDLHFNVIVPSIFKKSMQTVLQEACLYAGIAEGDFSFVRESEGVFSAWMYNLITKPTGLDLMDGKCFLIVNLKGRTASITAHTAPGGIIRRLHSISGGGWGGQAVNEEFKQLLIKIVGAPVFLQFVEENSDDWVDTERGFEAKKRSLPPKYLSRTTFSLSSDLFKMYKARFNESIEDAVNESPFAGKITILGDKMRVDAIVFKGLFKNAIEKIVSNINNAVTSDAIKDVETEVIFLVGGFSESLFVQDAVRKAFPNYQIICPEDPTFTVGKGAVLHGHRTKTVERRQSVISNFTYGVHFSQVNNEDERSVVERSETKILVRKGDKVYEGDKVTWKFHVELCDEEHIEMQFFVSPRTDTVTMSDEDVVRMEMVRIDVDGTYTKDVEARIVFNDNTFLDQYQVQLYCLMESNDIWKYFLDF